MSQALYEQYKEALRRGHVAALRGRLDVAEAAYRAAAGIAPDRALPHASLGGVLGRLGRAEEALAAYGVALDRAPDDEVALSGRAELHAAQGRRAEAALDFERLAGVLEGAGRLTDATDAARRALELDGSRTRRLELERLGGLLRERGEDRPAVDALDRALRILEAAEASAAQAGIASGGPSATPAAEPSPAVAEQAAEVAGQVEPELEPEPEPEPEPPPPPPPPDPAVLRAVADALLDDGDVAGARERLLALASLHRAAGRPDAAMDACLALLAVTPSDHRLQREIAGIQLDRGWTAVAEEKLRLLARLADLDGDDDARAAITALAAERGLEVRESPVATA
jgi:tetratricopeptide (TPR) repeat protein